MKPKKKYHIHKKLSIFNTTITVSPQITTRNIKKNEKLLAHNSA